MSRIVVTPRAASDLEEIGDYIAIDNPAAAIRMVDRLEQTVEVLGRNPMIGTMRKDIGENVRVFPVGNYLILFRSLVDGVEVVRYVHGARQLKDIVSEPV